MLGEVPIVGASAARLKRIAVLAWRKFASAIFTVWFAGSTWLSSSLSFGSSYVSHHFLRSTPSFGWATFQPSPACGSEVSLNSGASGVSGFVYFGPTMHPVSRRTDRLAEINPHCVMAAPSLQAPCECVQKIGRAHV